MFDFIEPKTVYLILHLIGIALGAGGAFMSDAMFFKSFKDYQLSTTELGFLRLGSKVVWAGLLILVVSGVLLFFTNPEFYLASSKFLAKMTIVGIIIVNGVVFHFVHMPRLMRYADISFARDESFWRGSAALFISGGVSMVSWIFSILLGAFRSIPFSYGTILALYALALLCSVAGALAMRHRFMIDARRF